MMPRADYTIDQEWERYSEAEHAIWRRLFERQSRLLPGRVTPEFLAGLEGLKIAGDGIPDFRCLSDILGRATGWQVVAVPGLVPEAVFFEHLANRRFPATRWIRKPEQLDYLPEPDAFHDLLGHVPLLLNPVFADYMAAYGRAGVAAGAEGATERLARLYWYTVEFGLIDGPEGLRIYGAGIVSSKSESLFCLDSPSPNRLGFDLERVMRTRYRIDDFQQTYFVIDDFDSLFRLVDRDLAAVCRDLAGREDLPADAVLPTDRVYQHGDGSHHRPSRAA